MTKICLLSDTHGQVSSDIYKYLEEADEIWHAGDIGNAQTADKLKSFARLRAVTGNIDGQDLRHEFPEVLRFCCQGLHVFMAHICGYPGKYSPGIKAALADNPPKLLIGGHSHILKVANCRTYNLLYMNPGAAGFQGFHQVRTLLRFTITDAKPMGLSVVELPKFPKKDLGS
jgi:uncharacterized protein